MTIMADERLSDAEVDLAISMLALIVRTNREDEAAAWLWFLDKHGRQVLPAAFKELRDDRAAIRRFLADFDDGTADFCSVEQLRRAVSRG